MTIAGQPGTKVINCGYPETDAPNCPTIPMVLVHRQSADTIYAVLYQVGKGHLPHLQLKSLGQVDGHLIYQVSGPWGVRRHLVPKLQ